MTLMYLVAVHKRKYWKKFTKRYFIKHIKCHYKYK